MLITDKIIIDVIKAMRNNSKDDYLYNLDIRKIKNRLKKFDYEIEGNKSNIELAKEKRDNVIEYISRYKCNCPVIDVLKFDELVINELKKEIDKYKKLLKPIEDIEE
jgi:hypothetical protein